MYVTVSMRPMALMVMLWQDGCTTFSPFGMLLSGLPWRLRLQTRWGSILTALWWHVCLQIPLVHSHQHLSTTHITTWCVRSWPTHGLFVISIWVALYWGYQLWLSSFHTIRAVHCWVYVFQSSLDLSGYLILSALNGFFGFPLHIDASVYHFCIYPGDFLLASLWSFLFLFVTSVPSSASATDSLMSPAADPSNRSLHFVSTLSCAVPFQFPSSIRALLSPMLYQCLA